MCLLQHGALGKKKSSLNIYNHRLPILRGWGTEKPQIHQGPFSIANENPLWREILSPGFIGFSKLQMC